MNYLVSVFVLCSSLVANASTEKIQLLKQVIVDTAQRYQGQGDPDFRIQSELEPLVQELVNFTNPLPVKNRLPLLYGTWKQVWGPYDYSNDGRGVDITLEPAEIYQVIDPRGFYYNVSPNYKDGDRSKVRVDYLKGLYKLSRNDINGLDVRFDKYIAIEGRPSGSIFDYVESAEKNQLPRQIRVLPRLFVKLFFGGGTLIEVYTDQDLRILYGSNGSNFKNPYLYVMTRVRH